MGESFLLSGAGEALDKLNYCKSHSDECQREKKCCSVFNVAYWTILSNEFQSVLLWALSIIIAAERICLALLQFPNHIASMRELTECMRMRMSLCWNEHSFILSQSSYAATGCARSACTLSLACLLSFILYDFASISASVLSVLSYGIEHRYCSQLLKPMPRIYPLHSFVSELAS